MGFHQVSMLNLFLLLINGWSSVNGASFTVMNKCEKTIWPGIRSYNENGSTGGNLGLGSTGFELARGSSRSFQAPKGWSGQFWGRTGCNFKDSNNGSCTTGDCGSGQLHCNGNGSTKPATLAEFALQYPLQSGSLDFYDISLVNGFNLPMLVEASLDGTLLDGTQLDGTQSGSCPSTGCTIDLIKICPTELRAEGGDACNSPCDVFRTPEYCCTDNYSSRSKCGPTDYSRFFKSACPSSYSYAYDDETSTFTCPAANYTITFCPSSSSLRSQNSSNSNGSVDGLVSESAPSESPAPSNSPDIRGHRSVPLIIGLVAVGCVVLVVAFVCLRRSKKKLSSKDAEEIPIVESLNYSLHQVQNATNNFSEDCKIGQGGFGVVYKGTLPNGHEVAVKKLSKSSKQGLQEFKNEILLLAKLQHRNLVRLLGFCFANQEMILIYEFFRNKSLDNFLFDLENQCLLDWSTRYKIIGGIARGLLYLHEDSRLKIIHRDLKASNVLLDEKMNPKIADFGTARLLQLDQSEENTIRIAGTYGYMAPEYAIYGKISAKSDVFSFGVLLLEIISGQNNNSFYQYNGVNDLRSYAWKNFMNGNPLALLDPSIGEHYTRNEVIHCIHVGLLCVQENPFSRPTMASVVLMLSSNTVTLPIPHEPAFFITSHARTGNVMQPHSVRTIC